MFLINYLEKYLLSECSFKTHFGMYCPGCGGTRALIALLQGDVIQSLKYNPIILLFILDILSMTLLSIVENRSQEKYRGVKIRLFVNLSFLLFIILFFITRNVLLYKFGIDPLGDISEIQ